MPQNSLLETQKMGRSMLLFSWSRSVPGGVNSLELPHVLMNQSVSSGQHISEDAAGDVQESWGKGCGCLQLCTAVSAARARGAET